MVVVVRTSRRRRSGRNGTRRHVYVAPGPIWWLVDILGAELGSDLASLTKLLVRIEDDEASQHASSLVQPTG